jgi:hypothetical protein
VYTDPDLIARAARVFDGLRADALPWTQTEDLLRKQANDGRSELA